MMQKRVWLVIISLIFLLVNISLSDAIDNYDDVLLVTNNLSSISMQIGSYFAEQRNITHWVNISIYPEKEVADYDPDFIDYIRTPIENYIINNNLQDKINYIITTKGVPLRHDKYACFAEFDKFNNNSCASVDSELTLILGPYSGSIGQNQWKGNPYYNKDEKFNHSKFGIYLVTRLDGFNWQEIKAMIDNATK